MNRSLIVLLVAILLILVSSMTLGAQGRGHFAGGGGFVPNVTPGRSVVVTPGRSVVVTPGRSAAISPSVVGRPPFAVAPGRVPAFGAGSVRPIRPGRSGFAAPVFSYYSPYI